MEPPNAYCCLVEAGRSLANTEILGRTETASASESAEFLKINQSTLDGVRSFLGQQSRVPVEFESLWIDKHFNEIGALRDLARSFQLEMVSAIQRGARDRALRVGLDLFSLANAARRGGLVLDLLVGVAFESIAIGRLRNVRSKLEPAACVLLANEMLRLEQEREPFVDIVTRDVAWDKAVQATEPPTASECQEPPADENGEPDGEDDAAVQKLLKMAREMPLEELRKMEKQQDDCRIAEWRLLAIDVALRACQSTKGEYPADLPAISPKFINHLPSDPFTGACFKYRRIGDDFLLYSPGPSGQDHGGQFGHWLAVQAGICDLCLDVSDYNLSCPVRPTRSGLIASIVSRVRRVFVRS